MRFPSTAARPLLAAVAVALSLMGSVPAPAAAASADGTKTFAAVQATSNGPEGKRATGTFEGTVTWTRDETIRETAYTITGKVTVTCEADAPSSLVRLNYVGTFDSGVELATKWFECSAGATVTDDFSVEGDVSSGSDLKVWASAVRADGALPVATGPAVEIALP